MGKKRKSAIGEDPLDSLMGGATVSSPSREEPVPEPTEKVKAKKVRATFHLPEDLIEEARDAVVFLSGPPVRLTLAHFAESALRLELKRLKDVYNSGKDFPHRDGELRGGRPIGS